MPESSIAHSISAPEPARSARRATRARRATLLILAALAWAGGQAAVADEQDVITFRQLIMKQLDAETEALGMIIAGQIPPDTMVPLARAIASSAKVAGKAFEPNVPGGAAKADVWAKWDDFSKRMQVFAKKTDEMAKASEGGNVATVTNLMVDALPCKQCHDLYRNKKN